MINLYLKELWLMIIFIIILSIQECQSLTICPTAIWSLSATTVAGTRSGDSGSNSSMFNSPIDVYVDNSSTIYVLDAINYRVQRFLSNSITGSTILRGEYGYRPNQFYSMTSMSIDANGSIYILDGFIGRVTKWIQGSSNVTIVAGGNGTGNDASQMNSATRMFIDLDTLVIWIADTENHRIVKWSSPTTSEVVCGSYGSESDQFMSPKGLFVDTSDSNTLYVADTDNHRIQMWLSRTTSGKTVAGITNYYGNGRNQLWWPQTLIIDTNRNMFIVDTGNSRIVRWEIGASSGVIVVGDITYGRESNQLWGPTSISFDLNGTLFVADTFNNRIQKFDISCPVATNISTTTASSVTTVGPIQNISCPMTTWSSNATTIAGSPYDVFVDNNDTIYVLDAGNSRVQRFLSNSAIETTVLRGDYGAELNQFSSMNSIHVDFNGNIYILDSQNDRVTKWTPGAISGTIAAGGNKEGTKANQLSYPYGMFIEPNTLIIWIADTGNSRIVRWESPSSSVIICGSNGTEDNQFNSPYGLFVDTSASNTLYVADTYNHRIQMWLSGATSGKTVAGQTGISGNGLNQLSYPSTLIVDTSNSMYIADTKNNRIMQWMKGLSSGMIVAGTSTYGNLPNQLISPYNFKFDQSGALIVADTNNNRIQKFSVSYVRNITNTTTTPTSNFGVASNISSTIGVISVSTGTTTLLSSPSLISNTSLISTSTEMLTTTTEGSFASIDYYPKWLLMIFCAVVIVMSN